MKKKIILIIIVLIVITLAGGVYYKINHQENSKNLSEENDSQQIYQIEMRSLKQIMSLR